MGIEPDTCSALWALERMSSQAVVLTLAMAELGLYRVQVSGELPASTVQYSTVQYSTVQLGLYRVQVFSFHFQDVLCFFI